MSSTPSIIDELKKASSAEEFFTLLKVDYEPQIVNVARLHILRRMGEYLFKEDFSSFSDEEAVEKCRMFLEQAYLDFTKSSPIAERLFKVHKDAVKPPQQPTLVQLGAQK
ncbi:nitrogenase stabilizing/protective protein NifW [Methylocystis bryophila]|nr:nitrogenase stabilizing/protective protein NifW [Methylocystis bryophila]BDV36922.1 nitrogenase-stabilizing/protective protein NifW [Methylocystis bryophila]